MNHVSHVGECEPDRAGPPRTSPSDDRTSIWTRPGGVARLINPLSHIQQNGVAMRLLHELLNSFLYASMAVTAISGGIALAGGSTVVTKPSKYSVPDTIGRIERAVTAKGMQIFAR